MTLGRCENDLHDLAHRQHFRAAKLVGRAGLGLAVDGVRNRGRDIADIDRLQLGRAAADQR